MEEYDLSGDNRFTNVDILALTNFTRVRNMMDETMQGEVSDRFAEVAGGISSVSFRLNQLKNFNRYTHLQNQNDKHFELLLGYWIDNSKITSTPRIGIQVNVGPAAANRNIIVDSMRDIVKSNPDKWYGHNLTEANKWTNIAQELKLEQFLNEEDHIKAIQRYFLNLIDELDEIKKEYPNVPWEIDVKTE